jgi:hypothetical protein
MSSNATVLSLKTGVNEVFFNPSVRHSLAVTDAGILFFSTTLLDAILREFTDVTHVIAVMNGYCDSVAILELLVCGWS